MRTSERILCILFGSILIVCGAYLLRYGIESAQNKAAYEQLEEIAFSEDNPEDETKENPSQDEAATEEDDFQYPLLKAQNADCVGWISIPGTRIDYPIMQAEDNNYYLHRGFDKEYAACGSIFLDYRNDIRAVQEHLILYGYQMKDGSMFKGLNAYKDPAFYEEHSEIILHLEEKPYTYRIAAVYVTDVASGGAYYNYIHKKTRKQQIEYLQNMAACQLYETKVTVSASDELLSLSTCEYSRTDGRLIVLAVRSAPE